MAKLKSLLRKRIKKSLLKKQTSASSGVADDENSIVADSVSSSVNSLNSDNRNAGPIDVDTVRRHRRNRKANSRAELGSLPKIAESRSTTPSIQSESGSKGSKQGSRCTTPVSQIDGQWTRPLSSKELALKLKYDNEVNGEDASQRSRSAMPTRRRSSPVTTIHEDHDSPGSDSISTINGKDIFERSRSAMSQFLLQRSTGSTKNRHSTTTALVNSEEHYSSLGEDTRSPSLSVLERIHKRERSNTPNSTATPITSDNKIDNDSNGPSPTSVFHIFDSSYPVKVDLKESNGDDSHIVLPCPGSPCHGTEGCIDETQLPPDLPLGGGNQFPRPPTPAVKRKTKSKLSESTSFDKMVLSAGLSAPPKINRISSKMFNDACESIKAGAATWDPLQYSSLEEAISAHASMLSNNTSASGNDAPVEKNAAPIKSGDANNGSAPLDALAGITKTLTAAIESLEPTPKKEFKALKKVKEKNEFKKPIHVMKDGGATGPGSSAAVQFKEATKLSFVEPHEMIEVQAASAAPEATNAQDPPRNDEHLPIEPPGIDATTTRSQSPCPQVDSNYPVEPTGLDLHVVPVDVIQSFSFDQDFDQQYSLSSDDSYSYISDMESIGEITICKETTRLLEAHKQYDANALTNRNHPSRRKKSIMKVGSRFQPRAQSSNASVVTEIIDGETIRTERRTILTWYDDEENWSKPFTLRTDESFDGSTVTSEGGVHRIIRYSGVDQFFGGFIKEIGKYTNCGGDASFDPIDEEQEI